ncbi:MAG TPA: DNA translocase FtsK 4TM domain-containing protein, partial [Nocardioides sp.]|uniref:DNA translocase FtsK 4TM domain-containing protein n=1 Tax=Nocardioides sp. TaxID=35761 RepID=UPI002BFD9805
MATRTSSPPGSRSKSTAKGSTSGRSRARSRSTSRKSSRSPARSARSKTRRPPRAVRSGPGPVLRLFTGAWRVLAAVWVGLAHAVGATARRVGSAARDLDPEHRRDGLGLLLVGLAVVVAGAVWWQLPGSVMSGVRTVVAGSVGKIAWLVPLVLLGLGWRTLRNPERNGPVGRQVVGWSALTLGVLGLVQIANGNPQPELGDASDLQQAGGAVGFVVANLLLDLLRTPYVVVPLLMLLAGFGVLVITSTPVHQVPARLRALIARLPGRTGPDGPAATPQRAGD